MWSTAGGAMLRTANDRCRLKLAERARRFLRCLCAPSSWMTDRVLRLSLGLLLIACLSSTGCSLTEWANNRFKVGPNHHEPPAAVAENWIDSDDPRVIDQPPAFEDWWKVLQDPAIDNLVVLSYQQNLTLREAGMRVIQARAQRAIAAGNFYPQSQQMFGEYDRIQESLNVAAPPPVRFFDQWSTGFDISWELDVWGKYRRAIESADANLEASILDYDAILVCLIAEVVTAYVDIRTFEQRLAYARHNVRIQEQSHQLTEARAKEGGTGDISVHLSLANVNATRARIPSLNIGLRQASNRLCVLLGMPPEDLGYLLGEKTGIPVAPREVAVGIPADLLRRRPDVRAAERDVAAQSAQIGVAAAELYPSISVTGEIALESEQFSDLFRSRSQSASIGPSFRWNILNYGRIQNNVRLQDARLQELIASYQNAVLVANQELEDALVVFLQTQDRVELLETSVRETQRALALETLNFKEGETDFTGVFVLQGELVAKEDQLAEAEGQAVSSLVAVYKALGGGWQIRCTGFQPHVINEETTEIETEAEEIPAPSESTISVPTTYLPPVPASDNRFTPGATHLWHESNPTYPISEAAYHE